MEDSVSLSKPVIVVTIQYRLNIFAFGSESSSSNLALKDQSLALRWVTDHISDFGGDPVLSHIPICQRQETTDGLV